MEIGRGEELALTGCRVHGIDALDLDAVLTDDARPGLHGVEGAGGAGGVFDEEKADSFSVGGPGGLPELAGEVG